MLCWLNPVLLFLTNLNSYLGSFFLLGAVTVLGTFSPAGYQTLTGFLHCNNRRKGLHLWEERFTVRFCFRKRVRDSWQLSSFVLTHSFTHLCTGIPIHTLLWVEPLCHQETSQDALFCFSSAKAHPCFLSNEFWVEFHSFSEPRNKLSSQTQEYHKTALIQRTMRHLVPDSFAARSQFLL